MIDIHSHILSGIDDGAKNISISSDMLLKAAADGITDMCVTPHYIYGEIENTTDIVEKELAKLKDLSDNLGIKMNLYPGNEIFLSPEIPELLKAGKILSLNRGKYLLVELPMAVVPDYTDGLLFEIELLGYTPVLAHPERNHEIGDNPDILANWKDRGIIFQINSGSITGIFGKRVQKSAIDFIGNGYAGVIASDCHTNRGRSPVLSRAKNIVNDRFGTEITELLFDKNPLGILKSEPIDNVPKTKAKSFFSFLKMKEALLSYVRG